MSCKRDFEQIGNKRYFIYDLAGREGSMLKTFECVFSLKLASTHANYGAFVCQSCQCKLKKAEGYITKLEVVRNETNQNKHTVF